MIGERLVNDGGRLEDNIGRYKVGRDWIEVEECRIED